MKDVQGKKCSRFLRLALSMFQWVVIIALLLCLMNEKSKKTLLQDSAEFYASYSGQISAQNECLLGRPCYYDYDGQKPDWANENLDVTVKKMPEPNNKATLTFYEIHNKFTLQYTKDVKSEKE
ncbi:MAG: hypothetical protein AB7F23_10470 [Phycisphaerae bacterium]